MKKLCALPILLLLAILPEAPAVAQFVGIPTTIAQLPTCNAGRHGRIWVVRDAVGNDDCSLGGGTDAAICLCSDGNFVAVIAASVPAADSILESMLKAVDAAGDEECLTYETTTGDFEWQSCGSGIGGSTGATDDAILIADGVGGATLAASAAKIDSTGRIFTLGGVEIRSNYNYSAQLEFPWRPAFDGGIGIGPGDTVAFGSNNGSGNYDVAIVRIAAGVLLISNNSGGPGNLLSGVLVEANTAGSGAPNAIVANESGTVYTNEGVTAKNYHTLPTAAAGYRYTFINVDTDGLRVTAAAGDILHIPGDASTAGGYCETTTVDDSATWVATNATDWRATSITGVGWACDGP